MASTGLLTVNSCVEMVIPGRDERGLYVIVLHWKGNGGRKYSQEGKESYTRPQGAGCAWPSCQRLSFSSPAESYSYKLKRYYELAF